MSTCAQHKQETKKDEKVKPDNKTVVHIVARPTPIERENKLARRNNEKANVARLSLGRRLAAVSTRRPLGRHASLIHAIGAEQVDLCPPVPGSHKNEKAKPSNLGSISAVQTQPDLITIHSRHNHSKNKELIDMNYDRGTANAVWSNTATDSSNTINTTVKKKHSKILTGSLRSSLQSDGILRKKARTPTPTSTTNPMSLPPRARTPSSVTSFGSQSHSPKKTRVKNSSNTGNNTNKTNRNKGAWSPRPGRLRRFLTSRSSRNDLSPKPNGARKSERDKRDGNKSSNTAAGTANNKKKSHSPKPPTSPKPLTSPRLPVKTTNDCHKKEEEEEEKGYANWSKKEEEDEEEQAMRPPARSPMPPPNPSLKATLKPANSVPTRLEGMSRHSPHLRHDQTMHMAPQQHHQYSHHQGHHHQSGPYGRSVAAEENGHHHTASLHRAQSGSALDQQAPAQYRAETPISVASTITSKNSLLGRPSHQSRPQKFRQAHPHHQPSRPQRQPAHYQIPSGEDDALKAWLDEAWHAKYRSTPDDGDSPNGPTDANEKDNNGNHYQDDNNQDATNNKSGVGDNEDEDETEESPSYTPPQSNFQKQTPLSPAPGQPQSHYPQNLEPAITGGGHPSQLQQQQQQQHHHHQHYHHQHYHHQHYQHQPHQQHPLAYATHAPQSAVPNHGMARHSSHVGVRWEANRAAPAMYGQRHHTPHHQYQHHPHSGGIQHSVSYQDVSRPAPAVSFHHGPYHDSHRYHHPQHHHHHQYHHQPQYHQQHYYHHPHHHHHEQQEQVVQGRPIPRTGSNTSFHSLPADTRQPRSILKKNRNIPIPPSGPGSGFPRHDSAGTNMSGMNQPHSSFPFDHHGRFPVRRKSSLKKTTSGKNKEDRMSLSAPASRLGDSLSRSGSHPTIGTPSTTCSTRSDLNGNIKMSNAMSPNSDEMAYRDPTAADLHAMFVALPPAASEPNLRNMPPGPPLSDELLLGNSDHAVHGPSNIEGATQTQERRKPTIVTNCSCKKPVEDLRTITEISTPAETLLSKRNKATRQARVVTPPRTGKEERLCYSCGSRAPFPPSTLQDGREQTLSEPPKRQQPQKETTDAKFRSRSIAKVIDPADTAADTTTTTDTSAAPAPAPLVSRTGNASWAPPPNGGLTQTSTLGVPDTTTTTADNWATNVLDSSLSSWLEKHVASDTPVVPRPRQPEDPLAQQKSQPTRAMAAEARLDGSAHSNATSTTSYSASSLENWSAILAAVGKPAGGSAVFTRKTSNPNLAMQPTKSSLKKKSSTTDVKEDAGAGTTSATPATPTPEAAATDNDDQKNRKDSVPEMRRTVSFTKIQIREYARTVGDHPSVSKGPPLALDWHSDPDELEIDVERFEFVRQPTRRGRKGFAVPSDARQVMLNDDWGISSTDLEAAAAQCSSDKQVRRESARKGTMRDRVDDAVETTKRSLLRAVSGKSTKKEIEQLWEQAQDHNLVHAWE